MVCGLRDDELDALLLAALAEDAPHGDATTLALGLEGEGRGVFLAKEPLVVCGLPAALRLFSLVDPECATEALLEEGGLAEKGDPIARVTGPYAALLLAERTSLNLLQRLCGIASMAHSAAQAVQGTRARIIDTRKTTPGLRKLEKYAVRAGGCANHRMGLSDGILIKDNHIAAAGSVTAAVRAARANAGHLMKIEVEVKNLSEYAEALAAGAEVVMLDNMGLEDMARAVAGRRPGVLLEASGGMTLDRVAAVAALGVDLISMGALTHSARAMDISLELEPR